jgi:CRISPR-associated protein Csm3
MTEQNALRQIGQIKINGSLRAITGLHIGGTEIGLSIGGADNTIIRNGMDGKPYIPGSSLKGKMRSLMDRIYAPGKLENVGTNSRIFKCASLEDYEDGKKGFIFHLFGVTPEDIKKIGGEAMPTRLIFRDAMMTPETAEKLEKSLYVDMPFTQVKTEVVIDRITSAATPRQVERVPAGAAFQYEIIFNIYRESDLDWLEYIAEAMELLENDYLGGLGTRGHGQVCFETRRVEAKSFNGFNLAQDDRFTGWKAGFERAEAAS